MIEKLKSIALTLLIALSLIQTYMLAYSQPEFYPVMQEEYLETELIGTQQSIDNLIFPKDIVLHMGDGSHRLLYPKLQYYERIYDRIQQRSFDRIEEVPARELPRSDWRTNKTGIELRFGETIPLFLLQHVLQLHVDMADADVHIERIWITLTDQPGEVKTYFFTNQPTLVYEANQADLKTEDIEQLVMMYEGIFTPYERWHGQLYLPEKDVTYTELEVPYFQFTPDQLQQSLFVDPGNSHKILERDGTEIYTDGRRGLQINQRNRWMSYTDPVPGNRYFNLKEDLYAAVRFVNQHGGWNGEYLLEGLPDDEQMLLSFRAYLQSARNYVSLPILSQRNSPFGYIQVQLQNGTITHYERSLLNLNIEEGKPNRLVSLIGGESLKEALLEQYSRYSITSVYPAYRPQLNEGYMVLTPVWAVQLTDGTIEVLPAKASVIAE